MRKKKMKFEKRTIDCTPTWLAAVQIYCAVLRNPKAKEYAKNEAQQEIERLAKAVDKHQGR